VTITLVIGEGVVVMCVPKLDHVLLSDRFYENVMVSFKPVQ